MKKILFLLLLATTACHKKPDPQPVPQPVTATNPPPPVVSTCQNATVMYSLPTGQMVLSNNSRQFTIPNFDLECGDTVNVFMRRDNTQAWFQLGTVDLGASYYALTNNVVTIFNRTGIDQEADIEAVLH